jgi:hypothetical protein
MSGDARHVRVLTNRISLEVFMAAKRPRGVPYQTATRWA